MFELTNDQRKCFGLFPVEDHWVRIELTPSPYDCHTTIAYLDGTTVKKFVATGDHLYNEYELCEELSPDLQYILPKTTKGKPIRLSASTLSKRTGIGMCLSYSGNGSDYICVYNRNSEREYYCNIYEPIASIGNSDFPDWVDTWCRETTTEDMDEISQFARLPRKHVRFREGDVFRFKINRRLYGYGRILLDYSLLRKQGIPFWDVYMGKPLICSVYHIVTERDNLTIHELDHLPSLPSAPIMDNHLYYGDYEIIGNIPIREQEDYPILYGDNNDARHPGLRLQCGKVFLADPSQKALTYKLTDLSIGFHLRFRLPVLLQCIEAGSNTPYWQQISHYVEKDLRNPKFRIQLEMICKQFSISPSDLIPSIKQIPQA